MNYWFLIGFVIVTWIIGVLIGVWYNVASKEKEQEYKKAVVDQANNTLIFGLLAVLGIFFGSIFGNISHYIIFGLAALTAIISLVPYVIAMFSTAVLSFAEGKQGLQWIVLFSRTVEVFSFIYLIYKMFIFFFVSV